MTNKSKMRLKKMNFLKQYRTTPRIAPSTRIDKYRTKHEEIANENIYETTRRCIRP